MEAKDKCHSLVLDLFAQWKSLDTNGYFRFTPPTHAVVALHEALKEHHREGGVAARGNRYARTAQALLTGMREMGFTPLLGDTEAGPLIQTFLGPKDPNFDVEYFQEALRTRGFIIYQGPLSHPHSFSISTIGHTDEKVVRLLLTALRYVLRDMNVTNLAPA
jgi:2-aminoethylphosphonate-pyruvate transaminase